MSNQLIRHQKFIWGPLCVAIAVCLVRGSPLRYPLQIVMCVGHLYGVALYYGTCYFEYRYHGVSHSRPEFLYFWVYYAGFNFPWVVVPSSEFTILETRIRKARSKC